MKFKQLKKNFFATSSGGNLRSCISAQKWKVKPKLLKMTKLNHPSQFLMAELRKP